MNKTTLLFLIIFIEGYVVLASELLAIRQLIPFVGSGTETVSIIISAVLLPLAIGYHFGGTAYRRAFARAKRHFGRTPSVRRVLLKNIIVALSILTIGLSYPCMEWFFAKLDGMGISHRLAQSGVYSALFLVWPIFLLGQTVPLVSNYFSRRRLSEITGLMLFFSTAGSFLGSVFSTIVLMMVIGVHNTVIVTLGLLCVLILLLARRMLFPFLFAAFMLAALIWLNGPHMTERFGIVSNNAYNTISVSGTKGTPRIFKVNRSPASVLGPNDETYNYIHYLEELIASGSTATPRDILIIGAGGFTLGLKDRFNHYTYVDIDPDIKQAAEEHFLHTKLGSNAKFKAASAREFIRNHDRRYDLVLVDVYTNMYSTPMECTTREFFMDLKKLLKPNALLAVHTGTSPVFEDTFTVRYHNTFASVYPIYTRQVMGKYNPWADNASKPQMNIVLYLYTHRPSLEERGIYTDDKNSYSLDRP